MMVASKFLYDDGVEDEVYNDAWAKAADLEVSALNREERRFLGAINWNLFVSKLRVFYYDDFLLWLHMD